MNNDPVIKVMFSVCLGCWTLRLIGAQRSPIRFKSFKFPSWPTANTPRLDPPQTLPGITELRCFWRKRSGAIAMWVSGSSHNKSLRQAPSSVTTRWIWKSTWITDNITCQQRCWGMLRPYEQPMAAKPRIAITEGLKHPKKHYLSYLT